MVEVELELLLVDNDADVDDEVLVLVLDDVLVELEVLLLEGVLLVVLARWHSSNGVLLCPR